MRQITSSLQYFLMENGGRFDAKLSQLLECGGRTVWDFKLFYVHASVQGCEFRHVLKIMEWVGGGGGG